MWSDGAGGAVFLMVQVFQMERVVPDFLRAEQCPALKRNP